MKPITTKDITDILRATPNLKDVLAEEMESWNRDILRLAKRAATLDPTLPWFDELELEMRFTKEALGKFAAITASTPEYRTDFERARIEQVKSAYLTCKKSFEEAGWTVFFHSEYNDQPRYDLWVKGAKLTIGKDFTQD